MIVIVGISGAKVAVAALVEAGDKTRNKQGKLATYRMSYHSAPSSPCSEFCLRSSQLWSRKCDSGRGCAGCGWLWLAVLPGHDIKWHQTFYQHHQPQLGHCPLSATLQLIRDWEKHFSNTMIISSVIFYIIWHSNWNSVAMNQTSKTENGHRTDEWIKLNEIVVWNG